MNDVLNNSILLVFKYISLIIIIKDNVSNIITFIGIFFFSLKFILYIITVN